MCVALWHGSIGNIPENVAVVSLNSIPPCYILCARISYSLFSCCFGSPNICLFRLPLIRLYMSEKFILMLEFTSFFTFIIQILNIA